MTSWSTCEYVALYPVCKSNAPISYRQNELRDGTQRSVGRQYYFIDYQHFCNVVKWRITEMRRIIDSTLRNVREGFKLVPNA